MQRKVPVRPDAGFSVPHTVAKAVLCREPLEKGTRRRRAEQFLRRSRLPGERAEAALQIGRIPVGTNRKAVRHLFASSPKKAVSSARQRAW